MGETLPLFTPLFNKSVQIESRPEHLTGESGALIQREIMERSGIIDWLAARLHDPRKPELITYPLSDLLRTHLLLLGQGWRDQDDADRLRQDPGLRVANSARRGTTPLDEEHVLASQPTLSRLVSLLSTDSNRTVLRQAIAELAGRRLRLDNKGHRKQTMTIDVDSLPVEVHGQQFGSEWNGHYHRRMYHPLVASCAETGDMLDGLLRPGNVHTAEGALGFILELVDRCKATLCRSAIVRCPPWRAKRRRVVPGSREATRDTRRAEGAKGDPKGASERGVQSYGRPVCSRNELAMLWRNAG